MKCLMNMAFLILFCVINSFSHVEAMILDEIHLTGKIVSLESEKMTVVDSWGQKHEVVRKNGSNEDKLKIGDNYSFKIKMPAAKLLQVNLPSLKIAKMDDYFLKRTLSAYLIFLWELDLVLANKKLISSDSNKTSEFDLNGGKYTRSLLEFFIEEAHATGVPRCFAHGWPTALSSTERGVCRVPWDVPRESGYTLCGRQNVYRCNPILFGPGLAPPANAAAVTLNPVEPVTLGPAVAPHTGATARVRPTYPESDRQNGICVEVSSQREIVPRCLEASRDNLQATIEAIRTNPARQDQLVNFLEGINNFCRFTDGYARALRNATNSVCANLGERLASIQFALTPDRQFCTVLENNSATGDASCPRRVKLICEYDGYNYIGYVDSNELSSIPSSLTAGQRLSVEISNSLGALVDRACGSNPVAMNTNCTITSDLPINQSVASGASVPGCANNICHLRGTCGVEGRAYPVNFFCQCPESGSSGGAGISPAQRLVACAQQSLETLTPVNFSEPTGAGGIETAAPGAGSN